MSCPAPARLHTGRHLGANFRTGKYNIVTVAEWKDQQSIDAARAVVMQAHAESGFNPQETMQRLGIEADIANYKPI